MSCQYCFLCATDEGVFLEITTGNKQIFHEQFETCSITKVPSTDQLPTKICHKCAYELKQCASFVKKYKSSVKPRTHRNPYCNLCLKVTKKEFIFDLSRDRNLQQKLLEVIQTIFKNDVKKQDWKFVCLACRYTVDLLLDLKNVSQGIATKLNDVITAGIDYSKFSKIKTSVLSRKTTTTESARQTSDLSQDFDHKLNETMRTRGQNNKLNNNQLSEDQSRSVTCNKCHGNIPDDKNSYQILKRGRIECKSCMKTNVKIEEEKQQNIAETKSCKVFLKDILKDASLKEQNLKVEESKKTYGVKKKDSPEEGNAYKAVSDVEDDSKSRGQKRLRSLKTENNVAKKVKLQVDANVEHSEDTRRQTRQRKNNATAKQNFDSDPVVVVGRTTRQKRAKDSSLSDADVNDVKHNSKRLKTILAGNTALRNVDISNKSLITVDLTLSDLSDTQEQSKTISTRGQKTTSQKVSKSKSSQKSQTSESVDKSSADDKDESFICKECQVCSENKLESLIHLLTHYKQPKLELERVASCKETNLNLATDDECEDQTETIAIRLDDDEEEATDDVNNLNISEHAPPSPEKRDASSEDPPKVLSKSEESTVDGEIAIKESDVDRSESVSKETEETQKNVNTVAAATKSPVRQRKRSTTYLFRRSKKKSVGNKSDESICKTSDDSHSDLDGGKETSRTQVEDADEVSKEEEENKDVISEEEDEEKELRVEGEGKEESRVEEEDNEKELRVQEEEKEEEDKEKEVRVEEENKDEENEDKENGDEGDKDKELVVGEDKEEARAEEENEKEEPKVDEENMEKEVRVEEENKEEVRVEGEDREEKVAEIGDKEEDSIGKSSTVEEENVVELEQKEVEETDKNEEKETTCAKKDSEKMDEENASESIDSGDKIVDEDTIDTSKVDEQHETKRSTKRISSVNGQMEGTEEITLIDNTESVESDDDNEHKPAVIEDTLIKSSTMSKEANSSNETDATDENNVEVTNVDTSESNTSKRKKSTSDSADVATEVLQEVLDLASAEVQSRQEVENSNCESASVDAETLENISREIQNTADMPALKLDSPAMENGNGTEITL